MKLRFDSPRFQHMEAISVISSLHYPADHMSGPLWPQAGESPDEWRSAINGAAGADHLYLVASQIGQGAALAFASARAEGTNRTEYRLRLMVHPSRIREGIGSRLLEEVERQLGEYGASALRARIRSDRTDALAFSERRGFVEYERMVDLRLDLGTARPDDSEVLIARLEAGGYEFVSLSHELAGASDAMARLYQLGSLVYRDLPSYDPNTVRDLEDFEASVLDPANVTDGWILAKYRGNYVGYTGLPEVVGYPAYLNQTITGVHPDHRRKGISTAIKSRSIRFARMNGYSHIVTRNMRSNEGMRTVNRRLGFRQHAEEVRLRKNLSQRHGS